MRNRLVLNDTPVSSLGHYYFYYFNSLVLPLKADPNVRIYMQINYLLGWCPQETLAEK